MQFVFAETHLKEKEKNFETRMKQTQVINDYFKANYKNMPVIVAGDFNEVPENSSIKDVMSIYFSDLYSEIAEELKLDEHMPFTTFKYRQNEGWVKRTIDYMFIARNDYY